MIDIIIPAYNAKETIGKTLLSINMQTIKNQCNVYIVNDGSDYDYIDDMKVFDGRLNITELKLNKNRGPGVARQVGMDNSDSEYIMFIDSDDQLYDCFSIENLLKTIENTDYDIAVGKMLEVTTSEILEYMSEFNVLHSKIYRREFIYNNGITFHELYNSEDVSFNNLCWMFNPRICYSDDFIYVYILRENSLTTDENYYLHEHIKYYVINKLMTIEKARKLNVDDIEIGKLMIYSFAYLYYYFVNKMEDYTIKYIYRLIPFYEEYSELVDENDKNELINWWLEQIPNHKTQEEFYDFVNICKENYMLEVI